MKIKNYYLLFFLLFSNFVGWSQDTRMVQLKIQLESLIVDAPGLSESADINVSNIALSDFLQAIANAHKVNLNIAPELNQIMIKNNFSNATVSDILLFVCKEYDLTIDFTGNILSIRKYAAPTIPKKQRIIPISYNRTKDMLSVDLQHDTLHVAFKQIMDKTSKNLVFAPGMENLSLKSYIQNMPFDSALDKIAFANDLIVTKTRDNYYLFEKNDDIVIEISSNTTPSKNKQPQQQRALRQRRSNFFFEITDTKTLNVDFENSPISNIVHDIGHELKQNMFTSTPLNEAGTVTVKANNISFDLLLRANAS